MPEHWTVRLLPPTQHQVDVVTTAIHLQLQISLRAVLTIRIAALDPHPEFRAWLIDGLITGFGVGQSEPWLGYAAGGYR